MKCTLWIVVLAAMFVLSAVPVAAAEDDAKNDNDTPTVEEMEQDERLLELRTREAEAEHEQNMRELELEERRIEIEYMRRGPGWPDEHQQSMQKLKLELEKRRIEIERLRSGPGRRDKHHGGCGLLLLLGIVVTNILLTVWVFKDMREQKIGRALWVPITLLAGVFGAIVYAIVRNADIRRPARAK